eukprot:2867090-Rhodomonas_salina.1
MAEGYEALADINMLEPNPANRNEAMQNSCLQPFWIALEIKEMDGLDHRGCFKKWNHTELAPNDRVFGSLFHYTIKCDGATCQVTNCKVRLVAMGNRMKQGELYEESFSPVPHATAA